MLKIKDVWIALRQFCDVPRTFSTAKFFAPPFYVIRISHAKRLFPRAGKIKLERKSGRNNFHNESASTPIRGNSPETRSCQLLLSNNADLTRTYSGHCHVERRGNISDHSPRQLSAENSERFFASLRMPSFGIGSTLGAWAKCSRGETGRATLCGVLHSSMRDSHARCLCFAPNTSLTPGRDRKNNQTH